MKLAKKILRFLVITVLFVALGIFIWNIRQGEVPNIFGYRIFRVVSQSMLPQIPDETCIIVKEVQVSTLKKGDIITYVSNDPSIYGFYNTHRIEEVIPEAETTPLQFITKGDANVEVDPLPVSKQQIVGKYIRVLPLGFAIAKMIDLLSNQVIYFVVVMAPILISLLYYIWQLISMIFEKEISYDGIDVLGTESIDANAIDSDAIEGGDCTDD